MASGASIYVFWVSRAGTLPKEVGSFSRSDWRETRTSNVKLRRRLALAPHRILGEIGQN